MIFAIFGGSTLLGGRGKKANLIDQKLQLMTGICSRVVRDNFGAKYGHSNKTIRILLKKTEVYDFKIGVIFSKFCI